MFFDEGRSAQGCRVALSQAWNSSAPWPFGATAKVASRRLTPPWDWNTGEILGKLGKNHRKNHRKHQETAFESTLALESLEPLWKFESLQSHCLWTQGQDCALGANISIRAPVEKESVFWSVLAADLSQVHHQRGITGQNRKQIVGKTTPKMLMICDIVILVYQIYDDHMMIYEYLWISMMIYGNITIEISMMIYDDLVIRSQVWNSHRTLGVWAAPASAVISIESTDLFERQSNNLTTLNFWWYQCIKH